MGTDPADLARTLVARARKSREQNEERLSLARERVILAVRRCIGEQRIARAWLIGSAAWGIAHARSDIDVVVEGADADATGALWDRLSEAAGMDVDLLRLEDLPPRFRDRVLAEGVPVHGP